MEEVYTCICGNQAWAIKDGEIECTKCKELYSLWEYKSPYYFNRSIREKETPNE